MSHKKYTREPKVPVENKLFYVYLTRIHRKLQKYGSTGPLWELNPRPLAPKARIIPLDQTALSTIYTQFTLFFLMRKRIFSFIQHTLHDSHTLQAYFSLFLFFFVLFCSFLLFFVVSLTLHFASSLSLSLASTGRTLNLFAVGLMTTVGVS